MNYSADEQTPLVGPKVSDTRGGYYGNQLRRPPFPPTSGDPTLVRPSSPRSNPPQPLHQRLDRAQQRHDQAHAITSQHWVVLALACLLLFGNYYCYDIPAVTIPKQSHFNLLLDTTIVWGGLFFIYIYIFF